MTAKRNTPTPRPVAGVGRSGSDPDIEEGTEERTIEFDVDAMSAELVAEASHGGGADQSRGGFRWTSAAVPGLGVAMAGPSDSSGVAVPGSPGSGRSTTSAVPAAEAAAIAPETAAGLAAALPLARAASRRAQSWNVGQTGNALERQYAS